MIKKFSLTQLVTLLMMGVILFLGTSLYNQQQRQTFEEKQHQTETKKLTEKEARTNERMKQLSDQYDKLFAEKNGTENEVLLAATKTLFSAVYTYDTSDKKQSVFHRKNEASKVANDSALEALFPKDADTITASVTTVSTLDHAPECYIMSANDREVKALVVVKNTIKIAEGDQLTDSYIYKIIYDASRNQFVEIVSLGNIKL